MRLQPILAIRTTLFSTGVITMLLIAEIVQSNSYAVGWGTLALLNAGLAQSKDRRGLTWFFVSLLVGPLATLLLLDLKKAT
jgi:hypothetical protein